MVKTLQEANKNIKESRDFYKRFVKQVGIKEASKILGKSDKAIYKTIDKGSVMCLYRYANRIADTMSAQGGTKNVSELTR